MMVLGCSFALTSALFLFTLPFGIEYVDGVPPFFSFAMLTNIMLLVHVVIGDFFHWGRFSQPGPSGRNQLLLLALVGVILFSVMKATGEYRKPMFYMYFIMHFWKDIDMGSSKEAGTYSMSVWHPKLWTGIIVLLGYTILSSGVVSNAAMIATARQWAWGLAAVLGLMALTDRIKGVGPQQPGWAPARFYGLAALFLLVFSWMHFLREPSSRYLLENFIAVWHFMAWYVFYGLKMKKVGQISMSKHFRISRLKQSPFGLAICVVGLHAFFMVCAWAHANQPHFQWLRYVLDYGYAYLVGYWTVVHITCNWPVRQVQGVRVGF